MMDDEKGVYETPISNLDIPGNLIEVKYFKAWLVFFCIASVGGGILGALIGGVIGGVLGSQGVAIATIQIISSVMGFIIGVPISFFAFKWSVCKYIIGQLATVVKSENGQA